MKKSRRKPISESEESSESSESSSDAEYNPRRKSSPRKNTSKNKPSHQALSRSQSQATAPSQSQSSSQLHKPSSEEELNILAAKCANFFLVANCKKIPIKRADIGKLVPKEYSRRTADIIKAASSKLREVFSYKVVELEKKGSFLLVNLLDLSDIFKRSLPVPVQPQESSVIILRTNILVVILMSGGVLQEGPLTDFVKKFGIDIESKENHPLLGNAQKLVYQDFVRQGYLEVECHKDIEPSFKEIRWGNRAKEELDKTELIQFVCKIYGESFKPEMWVEQWRAANREKASTRAVQENIP